VIARLRDDADLILPLDRDHSVPGAINRLKCFISSAKVRASASRDAAEKGDSRSVPLPSLVWTRPNRA